MADVEATIDASPPLESAWRHTDGAIDARTKGVPRK